MKTIVLFINLITVFFSYSQIRNSERKYELGFLDAHVIEIRIDSSINKAKDYCIYRKGTLCNLYRVNIKSIYFYSPNSYLDSAHINNMKHILIPSKFEDSLFANKDYLITVFGTPSRMYLGFSKILHLNEPDSYRFYHREPFILAITKCKNKRKNGVERLIKMHSVGQYP